MKRRLIIILCLFTTLLVTACGGTGPLNISWLDNAPNIVEESRQDK